MVTDKAWICEIPRLGPGAALVRAPTRAKARYLELLNVRDVFDHIGFADINVRRAPEYDDATFETGWSPRYATKPEADHD